MQENDELKSKTMASASSSAAVQNPNSTEELPPQPPPKVREEGELTSSDDDGLPECSVAPSASVSAPPSVSAPIASGKTFVQGVDSGKSVSANLPASSADSLSQAPVYRKGFSKNQVLLKSSNPGWHAPGSNSNLVISFSDDDESGSDGEERKKRNAQATNRHPQVPNKVRKPPALPSSRMESARSIARNERKGAPKVALSRTFISSMTKINGSSLRTGGPLAERRSWSKNSNVAGGILPNQDHGCSKNVDNSSIKLQDLRQQIAMRENELKLKIAQKNKENVLEACKDVVGQSKGSRKGRTMSLGFQNEPEEPVMKRLKTGESSFVQASSRSNHEKIFAESMPTLTEQLLENPISQNGNISDHANHDTVISQKELGMSSIGRPVQDGSCSLPTSLNKQSKVVQKAPGVSCSLSEWISRPRETLATPNKSTSVTVTACAAHLDKSVSPEDTSFLHSIGRSIASGCDLDSLYELEDLHDKELEEAQEYRRRCEIEERNALKAYRRAQRALAEANARCTHLYRRREMYSAQLRSFMMEDSSLLWSSRPNRQTGETWNLSNNASEANLDMIRGSRHQLQADFEAGNQLGYDSNVQSADGDLHNLFSGNEDGHNLGSEACSEPDASTSDLLAHGNVSAANDFHSPPNDAQLSMDDDDEAFPLDRRSLHDSLGCHREEDNGVESEKNIDVDSTKILSPDVSRDPLLHEKILRSKLISRLGVSDSSKKSGLHDNGESATDRFAGEDIAGAKTQIVDNDSPLIHKFSEAPKGPEDSICETQLNIQNQEAVGVHSLDDLPIFVSHLDETSCNCLDVASVPTVPSSSALRSAMKVACPASSDNKQIVDQHFGFLSTSNSKPLLARRSEEMLGLERSNSVEFVKYATLGRIDSYTCEHTIDPFWPLCMYELRGKCNNDECPWQHVRDHSSKSVNQDDGSDARDRQLASSSYCQKRRDCLEISSILTPPKYLVCLDSLKAAHSSGSLQAPRFGSSQKIVFTNTLAVSSSLLKHVSSNEPFLHGNDGCVECCGGNRQSLYFRSKSSANLLLNGSVDNDQLLETSLLILSQEVNKLDATKKALSTLSRALEVDPASSHLWIVYLLLYYSVKNSVVEASRKGSAGEDDFSCMLSTIMNHRMSCGSCMSTVEED